ncbi:MAG: hypothetical protein GY940_31960 [bacterium]|nr:hypothetical protein [bacterium]
MKPKTTIWTDQYLVSSYEVDPQGKLPLPSLAKFMQETAYNHANHLEFGYAQLKEKKLFWVLSRLIIKIEKFPKWLDKIQIRTWPSSVEGLLAYRDFQVLDDQDNVIGAAGSAWLMLDNEKHRPQRMSIVFKDTERLFPDQKALEEKPSKLPNLSNPQTDPPFPVRYSDLDLYDHVNNAKYMQWVVDSYPRGMHENFEIAAFEVNFLSESHLGNEILIQTEKLESEENQPLFLHSLRRKSDDRAVCQARVTWLKSVFLSHQPST